MLYYFVAIVTYSIDLSSILINIVMACFLSSFFESHMLLESLLGSQFRQGKSARQSKGHQLVTGVSPLMPKLVMVKEIVVSRRPNGRKSQKKTKREIPFTHLILSFISYIDG